MELTDGQKKGLEIACQRYRDNDPYTVIAGYAGSGKAQPVDTLIPTPNGYRQLGEIKIGDYVFDRHGQPTKVLGVYPQGMLDCYKIELSDGRVTYCNDEHLWSYYISNTNPKYNHTLCTKTLKDMMKSGITKEYCRKNGKLSVRRKYNIPVNQSVEYTTKNFSIDPYVIGAFLGDGCCRDKQLGLSSADEEIVAEVAKLIGATSYKKLKQSYTWRFYNNKNFDNCRKDKVSFATKDIFEKYPSIYMKYSYEKYIPPEYKYGDREQRFSLIQGLMDTDGNITYNNKKDICFMRFSSTSERLIIDMREIINSLGYLATIGVDKREDKYSVGKCFTLYINVPHEDKEKFFRLSRKRNIAQKAKQLVQHRRYDQISIASVSKCDYQKEMVCIYVDNQEHLYLTNDYIVTHNTTLVQHIIKELKLKDSEVVFACFTGKGALVLKEKGNKNAMTAHKLLYHSEELEDGTYLHTPKTKLDHKYNLIVVDEASMLPQEMINLLLSHHVYTIFLGDPEQLPPISGEQTILDEPHVFLNEIVRQALDNPIIKLSMEIRNGNKLHYTTLDKRCRILPRSKVSDQMLIGADQILCGKNKTRNELNYYMRKLILGDKYNDDPVEGDKVICLKNSWNNVNSLGNELVNGTIGTLRNIFILETPPYGKVLYADFVSNDGGIYKYLTIDYQLITTGKPTINSDNWKKFVGYPKLLQFAFGYVITCHKSQGSEFDKVVVFDEAFGDAEERRRWRYTACTRAAKQLVLVE